MAKQYRPFVLARAGELAGLSRLSSTLRSSSFPIFRIPGRAWDYKNDRYSKSHEDHISGVPDKLAKAWTGGNGYLDLSLLDGDDPVHGKHPLLYLHDEAMSRSVALTPLVNSSSTPSYISAAVAVHAASNGGAAVQLPQADWTTIDTKPLTTLLAALSLFPSEIDVIVDFGIAEGPVTEIAVLSELISLHSIGDFRSITVGGCGFPGLAGVPRGTTEHSRKEWNTYMAVYRRLLQQEVPAPDFFDHAVQNPDLIELGVDPRFISISAMMRYTVADKWLVAKGELFKGRGPTSKGGSALIAPLGALVRHPEYATPLRSMADDWIEGVVAGTDSPGAPQKWREWATVRHFEVAAYQLATLT